METPCWGQSPDLFFEREREHAKIARERLRLAAREYCAHCPAIDACREFGARGEYGVWGGVWYRRRHDGTAVIEDLLAGRGRR